MRVPSQGRAGYVTSQPETASLNPAYMFSFIQSTFLQPPQNHLKYLDIQLTNKTYVWIIQYKPQTDLPEQKPDKSSSSPVWNLSKSLLPDPTLTPSPNPCNLFRQRMSISCNDAIVATVVWLYHSPCLPKYIYTHITYFLSHNTCITIWVWKIIFCKNWKSQFNIITEETMPLWSAPSRSDTGSTWSLDTSHIFHRNIFLINANPTQTALNSPDQTQSYMWMVGWDW